MPCATNDSIMAPPTHGGTFQPLQHKSGALRDRLHSYTKSTLGAGGSINEAVSCSVVFLTLLWFMHVSYPVNLALMFSYSIRLHFRTGNHVLLGLLFTPLTFSTTLLRYGRSVREKWQPQQTSFELTMLTLNLFVM